MESQTTLKQSFSPNLVGLFAAGPFALAAFAVALVLGLARFETLSWNTQELRIILYSAVIAPLAYIYGARHRDSARHERSVFASVTNVTALVLGAVLLAGIIVPVLAQAFSGYAFSPFWGAVFLAAYAFMLAYVMAAWGARLWVGDTITFAVAVVGLSIVAAAVNSGDADWWKYAVSTLGTSSSATARLFGDACMVAGAMLVLAVPSLKEPLGRSVELGIATDRTATWFPRVMAVLGVLLFLVGAFPMDGGDVKFAIHNTSGILFGVVLVIAMALVFMAFPGVPRRFVWYSWVFAGLAAVSAPLYVPLHHLSLAELEVLAFALSALWAVLLFAILKDAGADEPGA